MSSKPEAYLQLHYIQIKAYLDETTLKRRSTLMVSCLSPPPTAPIPHNTPSLLFKVCWSWKVLHLSRRPLACTSFCHLSSHLRRDTSARWVSPRRKRWPPADTWRLPPLLGPSRPRLSFSCTIKRGRESDWLPFDVLSLQQLQQLIRCDSFNTNHFMRNISSPVESVAPIILSGARPRAKPRSFSVWGSNNKIHQESVTKYLHEHKPVCDGITGKHMTLR